MYPGDGGGQGGKEEGVAQGHQEILGLVDMFIILSVVMVLWVYIQISKLRLYT